MADPIPPSMLLEEIIQPSLNRLGIAEYSADEVFLSDLREAVAACLIFHAESMKQRGIADWPGILKLFREGRHVQHREFKSGQADYVIVESKGVIPEDVVLARACARGIPRARDAFVERYFGDWKEYLESLAPVYQRRFAEECESLWSFFLNISERGRRQTTYIADYKGQISLYAYLRMITYTKYMDWRKRLRPPLAPIGEAEGASSPDWIEISDCYQIAARTLMKDLEQNPDWLSLGEKLVLFQEIFEENDSTALRRALDVGASMISTHRKNLATKLEKRYGIQVKPHRAECACIDVWRTNPEGKPRFAAAVRAADEAWTEKMRSAFSGGKL